MAAKKTKSFHNSKNPTLRVASLEGVRGTAEKDVSIRRRQGYGGTRGLENGADEI